MTIACHHAPRETGTACQPRCRWCDVMIGQSRCEACLGFGRWHGLGQQPETCAICDGRGYNWVDLRTFVPTPGNRSEGET
jgi:hypothetical protein